MSVPVRRSYLRAADRRDHILDCALEAFAKARIPRHLDRRHLRPGAHRPGHAVRALPGQGRRPLGLAGPHRQPRHRRGPAVATLRTPCGRHVDGGDNVAFIEARCHMIMQVVFADADTASLILRMARGTGSARVTLARIDEQVVGAIAADVRAGIDQGSSDRSSPTSPRSSSSAGSRRSSWRSRRGAHHRCGQRRPGDRRAALVELLPAIGPPYRHPNRAREGELQPGDRLDSKGAAPRLSLGAAIEPFSASRAQGTHAMSGSGCDAEPTPRCVVARRRQERRLGGRQTMRLRCSVVRSRTSATDRRATRVSASSRQCPVRSVGNVPATDASAGRAPAEDRAGEAP